MRRELFHTIPAASNPTRVFDSLVWVLGPRQACFPHLEAFSASFPPPIHASGSRSRLLNVSKAQIPFCSNTWTLGHIKTHKKHLGGMQCSSACRKTQKTFWRSNCEPLRLRKAFLKIKKPAQPAALDGAADEVVRVQGLDHVVDLRLSNQDRVACAAWHASERRRTSVCAY